MDKVGTSFEIHNLHCCTLLYRIIQRNDNQEMSRGTIFIQMSEQSILSDFIHPLSPLSLSVFSFLQTDCSVFDFSIIVTKVNVNMSASVCEVVLQSRKMNCKNDHNGKSGAQREVIERCSILFNPVFGQQTEKASELWLLSALFHLTRAHSTQFLLQL